MKLVVGLGNPGRRYADTRHNVGFVVAEKVAAKVAAGSSPKEKFNGELIEGSCDGGKVVVLRPQTFMNASGDSVRRAVDFYKLDPQAMICL